MDDPTRLTVVGAGYVGLPMAVRAAEVGYEVTVLEKNPSRAQAILDGRSYVEDVPVEAVARQVGAGRLRATLDAASAYHGTDGALVCVPTPLRAGSDPDTSMVTGAVDVLVQRLRDFRTRLVALESTVYPGFTREVVVPKIEEEGLVVGEDAFVSFSPERVDPGNSVYGVGNMPKVVGGATPACTKVACGLYYGLVGRENVVVVSSTDVAEMAKLLENTFRWVNIGLVNEVALQCREMGIDVWEVIEAAATKPFGFMPFYPGPGVGGHCIPDDPYYLAWKLRTLHQPARFIELAGHVNSHMPQHVVGLLVDALNERGRAVKGTSVLVVGVAYKRGVGDTRESPALDVIERLRRMGAALSYVDPHVPRLTTPGLHLTDASQELDRVLSGVDAAVIVADHPEFDGDFYRKLVRDVPVVVDARNATRGIEPPAGHAIVRI